MGNEYQSLIELIFDCENDTRTEVHYEVSISYRVDF